MRYAFSDCVLDTDRCELRRAGRPVKLRPKVLQVLAFLIERADRVVPKEELFEQLWVGRVVGDATLNSCLKEARQAVGDSGERQQVLRTLHGQGYRFVAELREHRDTAAAALPELMQLAAPAVAYQREHKQVSVLACSLAQADARATEVGPETMDELVRGFFATAREAIAHYRGTVTEWLGDGFTALFGAPLALEDHARCAALAALEIRAGHCEQGGAAPVQIGLHSGSVVVGRLDGGEQLFTAAGDTTRIAKRLRDHAPQDTILASEPFYRLVETEVAAEQIAASASLGATWRLDRFRVQRAGVPHRATRTLSRYVGREQELALIRSRLELAISGNGQTVCLCGEPGIGKSRLLLEFFGQLEHRSVTRLQAHCLPYRQATPYFPLVRLLRGVSGIDDALSRELAADRLRDYAHSAGVTAEEDLRLLLELLDVSDWTQSAFDPATSRQRVFNLVTRLLLHASDREPCVVVIEDLHWMDASSEQWLAGYVSRAAHAAILTLLTFRPGYRPATHSSVTQFSLPRLNDADSVALVRSLVPDSNRSTAIRRRIVNNARGNPFFLEELSWTFLETGAEEASAAPSTVQAVLASRIDQLAAYDKALLQTAAVIGTPVPDVILRAVCTNPALIDAALERLEAAEFLYREDVAYDVFHHFKHALTQDTAYRSLLSSTRRDLHKEIAELHETQFAEATSIHPEVVAHHCTEAGLTRKAVHHWCAAGARAAQRCAYLEAVAHMERALALIEDLPEGEERGRQQLEAYLLLGPSLMSSKAFSSQDVEAAYDRAKALCDDIGTDAQLFTVLWGLWLHFAHRGNIVEARRLSGEVLSLAKKLNDDGFALQAHHAAWTTNIWHGDLVECRKHTLEGVRLYDRERHHQHAYLYGGHDPGVCAHGTAGIAAWFAGFPDEALVRAGDGARLAEELGHPYSRVISLIDFMLLHALRGEAEQTQASAKHELELCCQLGVPHYLAVARIFLGWAMAKCGDIDGGLASLDEGLRHYRKIGAERNLVSYLLLLADVHVQTSSFERGLAAIEEALGLIVHTEEWRWTPEILRTRGALLLLADGVAAAKQLFEQGRALAAEQGAKSLELRCAISLARLSAERDQRAEARAVLEPVYGWFTEGFATADLVDARRLLDRLS